jgi:hypothetical protein
MSNTSPFQLWLPAKSSTSFCLAVIFGLALMICFSVRTKAQTIKVLSPAGSTEVKPIPSTGGAKLLLKFTVSDPSTTPKVRIVDSAVVSNGFGDHTVSGSSEQRVTLNLLKGKNTITLFGYSGDEAAINPASAPKATIWITCDDEECGKSKDLISPEGQKGGVGSGNGQTPNPGIGNIVLKSPTGDVTTDGPVTPVIFVTGGINSLSIAVFDKDGNRVDYQPAVAVTDAGNKLGIAAPTLKMNKGQNWVRIFDPAKPDEKANEALVSINCTGCTKIETPGAVGATDQQKGRVKIISPKAITYGDKKEVKIKVKLEPVNGESPSDKQLMIEVENNKKTTPTGPVTIAAADWGGKEFPVKLSGNGLNTVTVYEVNDRANQHDIARITCDEKCGNDADVKDIAILQPKLPEGQTVLNVTDESTRGAYIKVAKGSSIKRIQYDVVPEGKPISTSPAVVVNSGTTPLTEDVTIPMTLKFLNGLNTIRIYDADHVGSNNDASIMIKCDGPKCATDFDIAQYPTNSMTTRAIVGMEQVGASSASSETKPFLDFFFTGGLVFGDLKDKDGKLIPGPDGRPIKVPRFGTWGQIRLSTTPQQTASAAVFPSNFVNQITDPTKVVDLVQSFDFLAGVEFRTFSANGWNWTLIPGIKQKSRFFLTFGAGAISPLTASRTAAQIFKIPPAADGATPAGAQRANFIARFGEPPTGKTYVGFVPLERDRFFRQYYFGIRVKTHYCEDDDCNRFRNRFPSIVDFAFGQNEAVTGGRFHQDDGKRAWVVRLDAFYPLPIREASFLYLYGTALMKVFDAKGTPGDIPLFLDTAPGEIQITDTSVFVPSSFAQPSRVNRDYYKIGIGVNLTDLFNRNKPKD